MNLDLIKDLHGTWVSLWHGTFDNAYGILHGRKCGIRKVRERLLLGPQTSIGVGDLDAQSFGTAKFIQDSKVFYLKKRLTARGSQCGFGC